MRFLSLLKSALPAGFAVFVFWFDRRAGDVPVSCVFFLGFGLLAVYARHYLADVSGAGGTYRDQSLSPTTSEFRAQEVPALLFGFLGWIFLFVALYPRLS